MKLKAIAVQLIIGSLLLSTLPPYTVSNPSTANEEIAPLLENLIEANGAESPEEAVHGFKPSDLGLKPSDLVNFKSGKLRPPRWYDFSCDDGFQSVCYSDPQLIKQLVYVRFVCNDIETEYFIPRFFLNEASEMIEYQFKSVIIANLLIGIPFCASRIMPLQTE